MTAPGFGEPQQDVDELSTAQLLTKVTEQTSELVRDEMALARTELQETVRRAGIGVSLFGSAGVVTLYGVGALVAAAILGLALALPAWLAALLVGATLLAVAAVTALLGRKKISQATPPLDATKRNLGQDIDTIKRSTT